MAMAKKLSPKKPIGPRILMPNRTTDKPGQKQLMPLKPSDKPGVKINMSGKPKARMPKKGKPVAKKMM